MPGDSRPQDFNFLLRFLDVIFPQNLNARLDCLADPFRADGLADRNQAHGERVAPRPPGRGLDPFFEPGLNFFLLKTFFLTTEGTENTEGRTNFRKGTKKHQIHNHPIYIFSIF